MKFIKTFEKKELYDNYINDIDKNLPNVSLVEETGEVFFNSYDEPLISAYYNATDNNKLALKSKVGFKELIVDDETLITTNKGSLKFNKDDYFYDITTQNNNLPLFNPGLLCKFIIKSNEKLNKDTKLFLLGHDKETNTYEPTFTECAYIVDQIDDYSVIISDLFITNFVYSSQNFNNYEIGFYLLKNNIDDYLDENGELIREFIPEFIDVIYEYEYVQGDLSDEELYFENNGEHVIKFKPLYSGFWWNAYYGTFSTNVFSGTCLKKIDKYFTKNVNYINEGLFSSLTLDDVTFSKNVTYIGLNAFSGSTINNLYIDNLYDYNNIEKENENSSPFLIAKNIYVNNQKITNELVLPNTIKKVTKYSFIGCYDIETLTIPDSVTVIEKGAFAGDGNLHTLNLSKNIKRIGELAFFKYNTPKTNVYYNNNIENYLNIIFDDYFSNPLFIRTNLYINNVLFTDLIIPNTVKKINNYSFNGCQSLTSVTFSESVRNIGISSFEGTGIYSVTIPSNISSIEKDAFKACDNLQKVILNCRYIEKGAFAICRTLTSITLNEEVIGIGDEAFYGMNTLKEIFCYKNTPPSISTNSFNVRTNTKIYVPASSLEIYKNDENWGVYKDNIYPIE